MRKFGLVGAKLSHTFSPDFFTKKFSTENITGCTYKAFPVASIEELQIFFWLKKNLKD
jgi:shikimate dehydrogenase